MNASHKLHVYYTSGPHKGDIERKEYFYSLEAACDRYRDLFRYELFGLNPTVWQRNSAGQWERVLNALTADRR